MSITNIIRIDSQDKNYINIFKEINVFSTLKYFSRLSESDQSQQKIIVTNFQNALYLHLMSKFKEIKWFTEYIPDNDRKDAIDIFGQTENFVVIIEIDKHRADQVAKKFTARSAIFIDKNIFYISLCYPGTKKMPVNETLKYFKYCKIISRKLGNEYAGLIITK